MKFERIFCFGDSITLGYNDSQGLGWPGRLCRGLKHGDYHVAGYNLGVNGDTSLDIEIRWQAEAQVRSRNSPGLLLFAFGFNDAAKADGASFQVDLATSVAAARRIMNAAKTVSDVLWIGPAPLDESVNPMQTDYETWDMRNADIERYDAAYAALAADIGVDYLQLFPDFLNNSRFQAALVAGDKVHPGDDGYALIAEHIATWDKWIEKL